MTLRPLAWFRSLHAKLFLLTALLTSALTLSVAYTITNNSLRIMKDYARQLAVEAGHTVETDILERDPNFKDPRKLEELLESIAGEERSIFQIDVFKRVGRDEVELVRSSGEEDQVDLGPELAAHLNLREPKSDPITLTTGSEGWKVHMAIPNPKPSKPSIGVIRVYCDLERWQVVWKANRDRTIKILPSVLVGEFILLWLILRLLIGDPVDSLVQAMERLSHGEPGARAEIRRKDELGFIGQRFNDMADQLQRASAEREGLIEEVRGFNQTLQDRIQEALKELQEKNTELAQLVERNGLLREELASQEKLAVAGQLTATFAHEVGTPLNLVTGHLQLLLGQQELPEKTRERLSVIQSQIQRVGDIVRRLLDLTRRPQLNRQPLAFGALFHDLQLLWGPTLAAHGIQLGADFPPEARLLVDRRQMEQLFLNLMNNAMDAMPEGGRVQLDVEADGAAQWRIAFRDTGQGIPAGLLDKVFRPMFTTKAEGKGTGLGLSICREIVRGHGGEIQIRSEEGKGTTVLFTLPAAAPEGGTPEHPAA